MAYQENNKRSPIWDDVTWKVFGIYIFIIVLMMWAGTANAQIQVSQFNASWNASNEVAWVQKLTDCNTISYIDISEQADLAKKHKIAVIPTVIIFKDDVEVARFQADLSFKMLATREEVQEEIDNQLMSDF
jgi:hypothetical protein